MRVKNSRSFGHHVHSREHDDRSQPGARKPHRCLVSQPALPRAGLAQARRAAAAPCSAAPSAGAKGKRRAGRRAEVRAGERPGETVALLPDHPARGPWAWAGMSQDAEGRICGNPQLSVFLLRRAGPAAEVRVLGEHPRAPQVPVAQGGSRPPGPRPECKV